MSTHRKGQPGIGNPTAALASPDHRNSVAELLINHWLSNRGVAGCFDSEHEPAVPVVCTTSHQVCPATLLVITLKQKSAKLEENVSHRQYSFVRSYVSSGHGKQQRCKATGTLRGDTQRFWAKALLSDGNIKKPHPESHTMAGKVQNPVKR